MLLIALMLSNLVGIFKKIIQPNGGNAKQEALYNKESIDEISNFITNINF